MQIDRFLDSGQRSALIGAAVFTALALLTRYVGVVLLVAMLPALLLLRPAFPWRQWLWTGAVYGLIALPPLALWMLSNRLLVGHWTGARMPPQYDFPNALYHTLSDLSRCSWPPSLPSTGFWFGLRSVGREKTRAVFRRLMADFSKR